MKRKVFNWFTANKFDNLKIGAFCQENGLFAKSSTTQTQTTGKVISNLEKNDDSNVQKPNYVGSIKIVDTNTKDEASESASFQGQAKISHNDAEKSALAKVQETVIKRILENENGYLVYSVIIKDTQGKIYDVKIDAGNGSVLNIEGLDTTEEKGLEKNSEVVSNGPDTDVIE